VLWNGNGGRTYFFQNEMPYDPPNQAAWMNGGVTQGYAAYKVADSVTSHEAWGLGSYCYFNVNGGQRRERHRQPGREQVPGRHREQQRQRHPAADLDLLGRREPEVERARERWRRHPSGFVVTEGQFNQMFPSRNSFYTYSGLTAALSAYPGFANTGSDTVKKQEAAAFLANVNHETGGLVHIVEQNTANYPHYCDWGQPYGCPAGQAAYYGRGPIQLSWNFNYKAAGDAWASTSSTTPGSCRTTPPSPGRPASGTGTPRTAPAR
jgi:hypothetical protein